MFGSHLISEGTFFRIRLAWKPPYHLQLMKHTFRAMKTDNGPANVKIPVGLTEVTMASTCEARGSAFESAWSHQISRARPPYRLPSERLPNNRTIFDGVFCLTPARKHPALTNINHIHNTDHEVITRTPSLLLLVQSSNQVFPYIGSEKRRMQCDDFGFFFEEKHCARLRDSTNRVRGGVGILVAS